MKKTIVNPFNYLKEIKDGDEFVLGVHLDIENIKTLEKIGFDSPLKSGDSIIPKYNYNVKTIENVDGKLIIRRDLPKEEYVRTIHWKCTDWGGTEHEGYTDIIALRYPREYGIAYNEEITFIKNNDGDKLVISKKFRKEKNNEQEIKFTMNLFLSLFKDFEVLDSGYNRVVKIKKVNFHILRPGTFTNERFKEVLKQISNNKSEIYNDIVFERFNFLNKYNVNDYIAVGSQGFYGYYAIQTKSCWIVECNLTNNATYIFGNNWEKLTQQTKQEVINDKLYLHRIYHNENWTSNIEKILK